MPTISGQSEPNNKALSFIESFLRARGMHIHRSAYGGNPVLVATTQATKTPRVMLVGHVDVVPASDAMFAIKEIDGRLYGRGVMDMKSGIAAYLMTVDMLGERLPEYDLGIMITSDEETKDVGVKGLIADGFCPTEAAVLFDGGYDLQVQKAAKGVLYFTLSAKGETGHGSRPWLVKESPSLRMIDALSEIKALLPHNNPQSSTINISMLKAGKPGEALNQIPAETLAGLDIRTLNSTEHTQLHKAVADICKKYDIDCNLMVEFLPIEHDMQNPHMLAFVASIEKHTGVTSRGVLAYAASDANAFVERGLACLVTYPIGEGHHSENEWIDAKCLEALPNIVVGYLNATQEIKSSLLVSETAIEH
jgi:acetylornithine deacetylase/succinyl-diaminopimelate desuccinylase-like protein